MLVGSIINAPLSIKSNKDNNTMFPSTLKEVSSIDELLTKCIHMELQQQHPNNFNSNNSSSSNDMNEWMIMEMALLLYMGEINDAFLLWRRNTAPINNNTNNGTHHPSLLEGDNESVVVNNRNNETQANGLELVWKIGAAMIQHDATSAFAAMQEMLQDDTIPKPLNRAILFEIKESYRVRMASQIGTVYSKIQLNVAAEKLGFCMEEEACLIYLQSMGWIVCESVTTSGCYLSPPPKKSSAVLNPSVAQQEEQKQSGTYSTQQSISMLTDIVTFLERKRVNA